ncbi:hypothetical protein F909_03990 [Acinetobacter sp. ANC 3929]|uniref:hypothetical protein n=1 Tax=unclassified Acinetobacter TaxID=196816 RepID=UPI0002CE99C5|nr:MULTISPECIES: hypothetical protein [unclassified Acinetobacter]ENW78303.1 hypothetical protein F909_03990 [Acinetobacter sp. ANC 3929]MCH7353730.1 hypothetical protein [Acinetobacter sp. NIPH 2023]MCH7355444.1 hypothetical protein [Acinetobacter sp. NIPH 1958]MCH7361059.1 hypothetical protein [Acinetobacter sp. NIPH 2024]
MRNIRGWMLALITSTAVFAVETSGGDVNAVAQVNLGNVSSGKNKNYLIKQSTKRADIDAEVDTQALKLGGIHRREDAREYLELKDKEESIAKPNEKTKNKNEMSNNLIAE